MGRVSGNLTSMLNFFEFGHLFSGTYVTSQEMVDREREEHNSLLFNIRSEEFATKITEAVKARKSIRSEVEEGK